MRALPRCPCMMDERMVNLFTGSMSRKGPAPTHRRPEARNSPLKRKGRACETASNSSANCQNEPCVLKITLFQQKGVRAAPYYHRDLQRVYPSLHYCISNFTGFTALRGICEGCAKTVLYKTSSSSQTRLLARGTHV